MLSVKFFMQTIKNLRKQKTTSCPGWLQESIQEGEIDGGENCALQMCKHKRELQESCEAKGWSRGRSGKDSSLGRGKRSITDVLQQSDVDLLVTTVQRGLDTKAAVRYEEERIMQLWWLSRQIWRKVKLWKEKSGQRCKVKWETWWTEKDNKKKKWEEPPSSAGHHCQEASTCSFQ